MNYRIDCQLHILIIAIACSGVAVLFNDFIWIYCHFPRNMGCPDLSEQGLANRTVYRGGIDEQAQDAAICWEVPFITKGVN